jgi:small subunit ribosomal protein S20
MPIIKSAKKRVKVAAKATARNAKLRRQLREALKAYAKAVEAGKPAEIAKTQTAAIKLLDKAAKKAVIHKNKAARKKSQLSHKAKAAGYKPIKNSTKVAVKSPKKSTKPAAKKTTAKKPAKKA